MGLKYSYTLFADFLIAGANEAIRAVCAAARVLHTPEGLSVLIG
jgi:hypothetical protein